MTPVDEPLSINCNFLGDMPNWATYHLLRAFYLQISCEVKVSDSGVNEVARSLGSYV